MAPSIVEEFIDSSMSSAFTEGRHYKIKVLKRNTYGYRYFPRFRKRILSMF